MASRNPAPLPADPPVKLGAASAMIVVMANMIGTGIFTTSGFIMADLENAWALLCGWALGGLFALAGALCYAELGARFPKAGGDYVFLRESFGEIWGFLSGWVLLLVGFSAPIAAAAMAFATYLLTGFGWPTDLGFTLRYRGFILLTVSPVTVIAAAVIFFFALLHRHSLYIGSRVQNLLTGLVILLILTFIGVGLGYGQGSWSHLGPAPPLSLFFTNRFASSLILISYAYLGWNGAAYLGEEIDRPRRNIPLALIGGTLLVTLLYLLLNLTYIYALAPEDMAGVVAVGEKAATALFGPRISRFFAQAIALGLLSLICVMMLVGPRVYLAMARDGLFFAAFGRLHGRRRTPANAIALQAALAIGMIFTASFENLLLFIGTTLILFSLLAVVGLMALRRRQPAPELPYHTLGYPLTPLVYVAGNLWIIGYSLSRRPEIGIFSGATILVGLVLYHLFKRYQRRRRPGDGSAGFIDSRAAW